MAVNVRIKLASNVFYALAPFFTAREVSFKAKLTTYVQRVVSVLLYGCESWVFTTERCYQLERWDLRMLRRMMGTRRLPGETWVSWLQRTTPKHAL